MTIITTAIGEKKSKNGDKLEQPLVLEIPDGANSDAEAQHPKNDYVVRQRYLILTRNALRPSAVTTLYLLMTTFLVLTIGIGGGIYFSGLCLQAQIHRSRTGWYSIPYDSSNKPLTPLASINEYLNDLPQGSLTNTDLFKSLSELRDDSMLELEKIVENSQNFFRERFELDLDNGYYEKIDVPDFRNGRQGRFIHDFNMNRTGIVDIDGRCCFVMPLDRERVLPPRNMYDLLQKMYNGYYEVDTGVVRETMKVALPPVTQLSTFGSYIARECNNMTTYLLQPVHDYVYKRSASDGVYGVFAGKNIMEINIINAQDIIADNKNK